jgi:ubiquitin-conjugating enzyme E2 J2
MSHAFNLNNRKFKVGPFPMHKSAKPAAETQDIFPAYATPEMTDLPDMGKQPHSVRRLRPPSHGPV